MICFNDWEIEVVDSPFARQFDHLSRRIEVRGALPEGWNWALLVQVKDAMDIISLSAEEGGVGADLTADQLSVGDAYYHVQLRGTQGDAVRHTNVVSVYVPGSLSGAGQWPQVPSEFTQVEQRILAANSHPHIPGKNGCWMLWDPDAGKYVESEFPLPEGGGADGADGLTPHIGDNGNWWIGDQDTGVSAGGSGSGGGGNATLWTHDISLSEEVSGVDIELPAAFGKFAVLNFHFTFPGLATNMALFSQIGANYKNWGSVTAKADGSPGANIYALRWNDTYLFAAFAQGNYSENARPGNCSVHIEHSNSQTARFYSNTAGVNFPAGTTINIWGVYSA